MSTRGSTGTERLLTVNAKSVLCAPVKGDGAAVPGATDVPGCAWVCTFLSRGTSLRAASWRWAVVAPMTICGAGGGVDCGSVSCAPAAIAALARESARPVASAREVVSDIGRLPSTDTPTTSLPSRGRKRGCRQSSSRSAPRPRPRAGAGVPSSGSRSSRRRISTIGSLRNATNGAMASNVASRCL